MSSKYTTNYKLNQWVKSDRVLMEDFNADNSKIDAALAKKAEQSALDALKQTVSGHATTLDRKGNCRVETFSYTGNGVSGTTTATTKVIQFSAKPALFIVAGPHTLVSGGGAVNQAFTVFNVDGRSGNGTLTATWSGNSVTLYGDVRAVPNQTGSTYLVTAFYAQDA